MFRKIQIANKHSRCSNSLIPREMQTKIISTYTHRIGIILKKTNTSTPINGMDRERVLLYFACKTVNCYNFFEKQSGKIY